MAEYINRKALLKKAWDADTRIGYVQVVDVGDILDMPVADVAPVVHGRWIHDGQRINGGIDWCHCSECGKSDNFCTRTNYCPNCGAKMDGGEENG